MIELLRSRRSVRKYTAQPVAADQIALLEEALLRAPSSRGRNPWQFVFVTDPALLTELSRTKPHGSSFLGGATLAIVVCGDESVCDVWVEDCSITAFIAHLAAHSLGLGSCWVQIRERPHKDQQSAEQFVQQLLRIPPQLRVAAIVGIGYPAEDKPGHGRDKLDGSKIHRDRY
ncbi:MAG: NAD(P)H-dependent dehydrogenase/reductase [Deltaproteobacteria bacterium]|nr:MAG: NAD(P)H-dependent dehydrogenase/reductase [Deltaproteobacteria bacterium]